jgi:vacuolar-type H+-ATPase subunit I/STV1
LAKIFKLYNQSKLEAKYIARANGQEQMQSDDPSEDRLWNLFCRGQQELEEDNEREQGNEQERKQRLREQREIERSNNNLENNKNARENLENNKKARDRGSLGKSKRANGGKGSRRTESTTEAREAKGIDENRYDFGLFEVLNGTTIRMTDETGYKFGANDGHD